MLDVRGAREIDATILTLRQASREIQIDINKTARAQIRPIWLGELGARGRTTLEQRVIVAGAGATATSGGVTLTAANNDTPLSGGLRPSRDWPAVEFGARPKRVRVRQRSRGGRWYTRVTTVNRQFKARQRFGMVAMDAASETGTQLVGIWVDTVIEELAKVNGAEVVG